MYRLLTDVQPDAETTVSFQ